MIRINISNLNSLFKLSVLLLLAVPISAVAESKKCAGDLPAMANARSNHSNDLLSVICKPTDQELLKAVKKDYSIDYSKVRKIKCDFQQVLFSQEATPEKVDRELEEIAEQLKAEKKDWIDLCDRRIGITMKLLSIKDGVGEKRMIEPLRDLDKACEKKDSDEVKMALKNLNLLEKETCTVFSKSWMGEFSRLNDQKWISQGPPTGDCNLVAVEMFECGNDSYWEYRTTRVEADKGEFCDRFQATLNKPMISGHRFPLPLEMKCSFFK